MNSRSPLVIGHRGASAHLPENTLPSFKMAFEKFKAGMIEFDVHLSRDGIPVVIHDETLERTTNGKGLVRDYTLNELKKLDAGHGFDPGTMGRWPQRGKGILIPALEEVFEAFPDKELAVEIKATGPDVVAAVAALVRKYGREQKTIVGSLEHATYLQILRTDIGTRVFSSRKKAYQLLAEYFCNRSRPRKEPLLVASLPVESKFFDLKKPAWIDWLHKKQATVYYWTVNVPALALKLAASGADGIMSDDPDMLQKALSASSL
ncbi:MAG TPA: glycerophosphodiester phosphodiesterase family protein [Verrucomicrobiae bacterium]|jgi:glycerophosphoryl diester phosphodiesterase|nr:glycerophosphodiester phosphodiesterase family protein [Verrucomicrobiae bacterium]